MLPLVSYSARDFVTGAASSAGAMTSAWYQDSSGSSARLTSGELDAYCDSGYASRWFLECQNQGIPVIDEWTTTGAIDANNTPFSLSDIFSDAIKAASLGISTGITADVYAGLVAFFVSFGGMQWDKARFCVGLYSYTREEGPGSGYAQKTSELYADSVQWWVDNGMPSSTSGAGVAAKKDEDSTESAASTASTESTAAKTEAGGGLLIIGLGILAALFGG